MMRKPAGIGNRPRLLHYSNASSLVRSSTVLAVGMVSPGVPTSPNNVRRLPATPIIIPILPNKYLFISINSAFTPHALK